ncbi:MAG: metallophosphoesterase [Rhodothermales bacterium]
MRYAALALLLAVAAGCQTSRYIAKPYQNWAEATPPPDSLLAFELFLIGDTGYPVLDGEDPVFSLLEAQTRRSDSASAVVFLGDNIYCCGIPDSSDAGYETASAKLNVQLDALLDFKGQVFLVPGNHDWNHSKVNGLRYVRNQERYVESYKNQGFQFIPDGGTAGPLDVVLSDDLVLVAVDTEWWLTTHARNTGDVNGYEVNTNSDLVIALEDVLRQHRGKQIVVVGHHPFYSNGVHSGFFPFQAHLFPLTMRRERAFVPLPFLGSIVPLFIRGYGGLQDLAHPRYTEMREAFTSIFNNHPNLIYAAGHDHSMQYFQTGDLGTFNHHIVSGSGSSLDTDAVGSGRGATFVSPQNGFATVRFYDDGAGWLSFWTTNGTDEGELLFRTQIIASRDTQEAIEDYLEAEVEAMSYADSTVTLAANPTYATGPLREWIWGNYNRDAWTTPVTMPVLDMGTAKGGLEPKRRGGGRQTRTLHLENPNGDDYILRSLDKYADDGLPFTLTRPTDVAADQVTTINPYGALILPPLAEAVGIYYTNPALVYVPNDPRLGPYRRLFADTPMLLVDRPNGDAESIARYGNADKVVSAAEMYLDLNDDNDDRVDQSFYLRNRLFDILLSDWDRHRDQWRWAVFDDPDGKGRLFRPIPRDRDWALNQFDGLIPRLYQRFLPRFQDFDESFGNLKGLTTNGFDQDRRFTAMLTEAEWVQEAESMQALLTEAVIDSALARWPVLIRERYGADTAELLKVRRDQLPEVARRYYQLLARVVDVVGSNKHERFEIQRLTDQTTEVVVYKTKKEGDVVEEIYRRLFHHAETDELRLYGLDGNDTFVLSGSAQDGPMIRIVGGPGTDQFTDSSRLTRTSSAKTIYYDDTEPTLLEPGPDAKIRLSPSAANNAYDAGSYRLNARLPLVFTDHDPEGGFSVGGGVRFVRHGFRKSPYAAERILQARVRLRSESVSLAYRTHRRRITNRMDGRLTLLFDSPNTIHNYFGMGNGTGSMLATRFYETRLTRIDAMPSLVFDRGGIGIQFGPRFNYTRVERNNVRLTEAPRSSLDGRVFGGQSFAGVDATIFAQTVYDPIHPRRGFRFSLDYRFLQGLNTRSYRSARLGVTMASYYTPFYTDWLTIALRGGAERQWGSVPYYHQLSLGHQHGLRGYRSHRFVGRGSVFVNSELRATLKNFRTLYAIGEFGVLGFLDQGRVWATDESSRAWHLGYGAGLWTRLFEQVVVQGTVGLSREDETFGLGFGFAF